MAPFSDQRSPDRNAHTHTAVAPTACFASKVLSDSRNLEEVELHGRLSPEERNQNANFALFGVDRVDDTDEVGEGTVDHLHSLALREAHLHTRRFHLHATENPLYLGLFERARMRARAHEARHARRVPHDVPGVVRRNTFVGDRHLNENVARKHLSLDGSTLAVLDLHLFFG